MVKPPHAMTGRRKKAREFEATHKFKEAEKAFLQVWHGAVFACGGCDPICIMDRCDSFTQPTPPAAPTYFPVYSNVHWAHR